MNRPRLRRLIEVLEKVRDEERPFCMDVWVAAIPDDEPPLLTVPVQDCGTASCALGWAARDPVLRAEGLGFYGGCTAPHYKEGSRIMGSMGLRAGADFFEIGYQQSAELFLPSRYPGGQNEAEPSRISPDEVIAKIKKLLDDEED